MPLKIACPNCRKSLTVPDHLGGRAGKCPGCGASVSVPPLPPPPADIPVAAVEPLVATVVHDAPPPPPPRSPRPVPAATRFAGLRNRTWKFWLTAAAGFCVCVYVLSLFWHMSVIAMHSTSRLSSESDSEIVTSQEVGKRLPFTLQDFRAALGRPGQESATSLLYSGAVKVTHTGSDITVAFNQGTMEGLFYVAGLFKGRPFQYPEGDQIMDQIDDIGHEGRTERFRYRIENAGSPYGWRQVRFMPL